MTLPANARAIEIVDPTARFLVATIAIKAINALAHPRCATCGKAICEHTDAEWRHTPHPETRS